MPERPLLILPSPGEPLPRRRRGGGGGAPHLPGRVRQAERLDPKFDALQEALEARRVRVQAESHDLVPEEVIVLETIDTVEHFIRAVEKVPGMEWLAEIEETDIPPDDDLATGGNEPARLGIYGGTLAPGHRVAAPGSTAGDLAAAKYTRGTSNAAALISRAAGSLYEVLEELRNDPGGELIDVVPRAVWLKALIAHGADWGTVAETLRTVLGGDDKVPFRERATRLLGYGVVDTSRVRDCTASRVTTLGAGLLKEDESHVHRFPLAPSLSGWRGHRRLTISLAWLSPVNPRHRGWRRAQLWFSPPMAELGVARQQADWQAVQRSAMQHEILEGESSRDFGDEATLEIQVNCRADAGALEEEVPYALVATVEVTSDLWVSNIYDEVRAAVQAARLRVAAARVNLP